MCWTTTCMLEKSLPRKWYMYNWSQYWRRSMPMSAESLWNLVSLTKRETMKKIDGSIWFSCELASACESNPCVQGICQNKNPTTYQCICKPGFAGKWWSIEYSVSNKIHSGKKCDTPFDICNNNPCVNGGTCSNLGNGLFVCACPAGFTGNDRLKIPLD